MSKTHLISWAAGFFDGEGYVTICNRNYKGYKGFFLRIGINHVKLDPLIEMQKLFGGKIEKQKKETVVGNRKQRHRWVCNTLVAKNALIMMMPYFKNKQKVAELGIEFQNTYKPNNSIKITDELNSYRANFKKRIMALNSED